jgi:acetylornithine deacetylase/succinyl-diaminopimelate desuccinylase-like protein
MIKLFRLGLILCLLVTQSSYVQPNRFGPREIDWDKANEEAVSLLASYLKVNTTNPPGNELRAAEFFSQVLKREGIEHKVFESERGRANLYARLKGTGRKRPLILLNHTDVVPAESKFWSVDPFAGAIRDGYLYGRGALDMKSLGIAQFMTMLLLKRSGAVLDRDLIFLATADEEAGGAAGAGWFVKNHPELIREAEFAVTEGSNNSLAGNRVIFWGIGTTEKTPCWLRLTATGNPGHGSVPRKDSAPSRLIRALGKLEAYETRVTAVPAAARFFKATADFQGDPELKRAYSDVTTALSNQRLRAALLANPQNAALLRNTIQPTVVNVGSKTNVIAPIATAEIDCRLLPGQRPEDFVNEIKTTIDDPTIEVETLLAFGATESSIDTEFVRTVKQIVQADEPEARFVPTVLAGFTDSHYLRDLGISSYGFSPFLIQLPDSSGVHGNNERISVDVFRNGTRLFHRIVLGFCGAQP